MNLPFGFLDWSRLAPFRVLRKKGAFFCPYSISEKSDDRPLGTVVTKQDSVFSLTMP